MVGYLLPISRRQQGVAGSNPARCSFLFWRSFCSFCSRVAGGGAQQALQQHFGWLDISRQEDPRDTDQSNVSNVCVQHLAMADWKPSAPEGFDYAKGIEKTQLRNSVAIEEIPLIAWHLLKHLNTRCLVSRGEVL